MFLSNISIICPGSTVAFLALFHICSLTLFLLHACCVWKDTPKKQRSLIWAISPKIWAACLNMALKKRQSKFPRSESCRSIDCKSIQPISDPIFYVFKWAYKLWKRPNWMNMNLPFLCTCTHYSWVNNDNNMDYIWLIKVRPVLHIDIYT